jgi:hypothetical protein
MSHGLARAHYYNIKQLARRTDDRDPGTPSWIWCNLTADQTDWTESSRYIPE